jgi:hypothetical protein
MSLSARTVWLRQLNMALTLASAHLNDDDFLEAFHSCRLDNSQFRHADHLRLAWIHLHRQPFEEALRQVRAGVQAFAAHHNLPHLYHETITVAWMHLLSTHHESTFEEFLAKSESRLGKDLLFRFWSPELLDTREAREAWIPPDRQGLPALPYRSRLPSCHPCLGD